MNQTQSFNLVDPFEEQSVLSLNPRTLRLSTYALKSKDLEAVHQYMKSMALQSPDKHFEKAKSVVDGGLESLKTKKSEADIKEKENPQQHRPGLVRRRAKFSLKPDTSQSSTILEPSLEIDHLQDPEEFFAAFEKFENTKKELKKQRGEDVDEVKTATTVRHRRPEIPRRKVSYKHHEYSSQSQDDSSVAEETLQDNIGSQPTQSLQQESFTPNLPCEEEEVTGSISKSENRVQELFDELLASNIHNLDGNQALSFLKDRMKIKSVDIDELQLPDFHEIPRIDFISPVKNLVENSQSLLTNTHALRDVTKGKTLAAQIGLSNNNFQSLGGSPTPPRSPFSAIAALGKQMLKSIVSKDPFSSHDLDSPPITSTKIIGGGSSHANKDKEFLVSATLHSLAKENITETATGDMGDRDHNMEEKDADVNVTDIQTNKTINGNAADMMQETASVTEVNLNVEDITEEENVEDMTEKAGASSLPEVNVEVSEVEDLSQPDANSIQDPDVSAPTQILDILPQQQNEEEHQIPRTRTNKRKKIAARTSKIDPKKRRQSLAGAGSSWTSGVRRSSRIKRRPLEYWKGERLLYARVHNSLPTVIGVKYLSPTSKEEGGFKVESFVSDKYKHLVELTALH
ncbi:centromere protein C isoform X2 [Lactuca sativa]|uniref:centromere protein C isoform X2 n=1 Tax=Lactuca sativa TaxID=4236 RepID=UPI000CD81F78|nr:centromere protein C isoform X2 [Lactuca sativa]